MIKKFVIAVFAFVLIAAGLGAVKMAQFKEMASHPHEQPILGVSSFDARSESWRPTLSGIGSLAPVEGVALSTEVEGTVVKINFENGQMVHAGDLLIALDTSVEEAQLKSAEAQLVLAQLGSKRANELIEKNTISQAEVDQATAQLNQAQAAVDGLKATIAKKNLVAPFDGRVGIRLVNIGQFITRGQALVPLQKVDQLYVNFTLPEREVPSLKVGETVSITVDAYNNREFKGKLNAISPEVDNVTRNISVQALLENPGEVLRPGMFARVQVEMPEAKPVVVVPATAVAYAAYGNSVFIIEQVKGQDGKEFLGVRQQFVKIGVRRGDLISIVDGVKPGEKVVSTGTFKLRNGMPVEVHNDVVPTSNENPNPANT
jgi:membrane fusion protein (multidrug efflux system)